MLLIIFFRLLIIFTTIDIVFCAMDCVVISRASAVLKRQEKDSVCCPFPISWRKIVKLLRVYVLRLNLSQI